MSEMGRQFQTGKSKNNDKKADPYGMTNKGTNNSKSNHRSFDSATRKGASCFAQDDTVGS